MVLTFGQVRLGLYAILAQPFFLEPSMGPVVGAVGFYLFFSSDRATRFHSRTCTAVAGAGEIPQALSPRTSIIHEFDVPGAGNGGINAIRCSF